MENLTEVQEDLACVLRRNRLNGILGNLFHVLPVDRPEDFVEILGR